MFGHPIVPLGKPPPPRKFPRDRAMWGSRPGEWGVMSRRAGSDWNARRMDVEQKKAADKIILNKIDNQERTMLCIRNAWEEACDKRVMMGKLKRKVELGMKCYEEELVRQREELRMTQLAEEAALERELVDKAQRLHEANEAAMLEQIEQLKCRREAEKKAFVDEKRLQQYRARCEDIRPIMSKRNLLETKEAQWYQIKEKELLRAQEKELDNMWTAVMLKDIEAKRDREIADVKERYSKDYENSKTLKMQMAGLEAQKKFRESMKEEERIECDKIKEEIQREKIIDLKEKIKKRDDAARTLKDQINKRQAFLDQRRKEEYAIDNTFARLAVAELKREQAAITDNTERLKRELTLYRENLEELRQERLLESRELDRLLNEEQKLADERRDESRRKIGQARQKLLDETVCGLHQQMDQQRQRQEAAARLKEAERETALQMWNKNKELDEATKRESLRQKELYSLELKDQMEYNNLLKKRQQDELDRQYKTGLIQEEQYVRLVKDLLTISNKQVPHPFRKALLGETCATEAKE